MRRHRAESAEHDLKFLVNASENSNKCGECGTPFPTYCSVNLGVFLCGRCASVHRKILGSRTDGATSIVKSLSLERWSKRDIQMVADLGGNRSNHEFWNPKNEPFPFDGDDDRSAVEMFIRDKYLRGKFRNSPVRIEDLNIENDSTQLNYTSTRNRSSSGASRRNRSSSTIERAKSRESATPALPKRPEKKVQETVFDGTGDPRITPPVSAVSSEPRPAVFDGVQQYYDPATGQIYVDQNSYMAMQQAQQLQQPQQVLVAQSTPIEPQYTQAPVQPSIDKNTLLALYQRPDLYTSAVEIKPDNPQYEQIQLQFQQQQLLQQQQQQQMQFQPQQQFQQQFYSFQ
ncbi:hypothetical protein C6P41_001855 [Kluyveromyces marxianus]|nr:hypothetical protein C6P41_001855 [Kluyveromyces marxianus]